MTPLRIVTILGVRPEFIKAVALTREIASIRDRHGDVAEELIVHTGQHYDRTMSDVFFEELELPVPDRSLGVGSDTHGRQTGAMLQALDPLLEETDPDLVVVYGDTNSTLAGALAASKLHIPVAHIEAGLRSFNSAMPEELNRKLTDHVSSLLFAPSALAVENLAAEGIKEGVHMTGDLQFDAVRRFVPNRERVDAILERHGVREGGFAVATVHRAENTDDPDRLDGIASGLRRIAVSGLPIVFPVHPRTRRLVDRFDLGPEVRLVEPVGFVEMIALCSAARVGLTDSGGLQKELYWLETPCVTLRDETEWRETVDAGWNLLAGTDADAIVAAVDSITNSALPEQPLLYGDGRAAGRILDVMLEWYRSRTAR